MKIVSLCLISFSFAFLCRCANECKFCDCCATGKENCIPTDSSSSCFTCIDGYWGGRCANACPDNCVSCEKEPVRSGNGDWPNPILYHACTECVDGKYIGETISTKNCTLNCSAECKTCTSLSNCTVCKTGYYLDKGICLECSATCVFCASSTKCTQCTTGYYGDSCNLSCATGCQDESCNEISGTCACKAGFTGENCDKCADTFYGQNCSKCSENCLNQKCNKESGYCVGCVSPNLRGNFCEKCLDGKYGSLQCDMNCPTNCIDTVCERDAGVCFNCKDGFEGVKCDVCVPGKFGVECAQNCSANCKNQECFRNNGTCLRCADNFIGLNCDQCNSGLYSNNCSISCVSANCFGNVCNRYSGLCEQCADGWYGGLCNKNCSVGCKHGTCSRETGICNDGCVEHYSGDKCCIQNANCLECSSATVCATCVSGFYGANCLFSCSSNCKLGCFKASGECSGCTKDRFGIFCNDSCSDTCMVNGGFTRCDELHGECLLGCSAGYFGNKCYNICTSTCADQTCDYFLGICLTDDEKMFTSEEMIKNLAIAVVVTCLLSVSLALGLQYVVRFVRQVLTRLMLWIAVLVTLVLEVLYVARFVRTRQGSKHLTKAEDRPAREQTVRPYEMLETGSQHLADYDTIQSSNPYYINTNI